MNKFRSTFTASKSRWSHGPAVDQLHHIRARPQSTHSKHPILNSNHLINSNIGNTCNYFQIRNICSFHLNRIQSKTNLNDNSINIKTVKNWNSMINNNPIDNRLHYNQIRNVRSNTYFSAQPSTKPINYMEETLHSSQGAKPNRFQRGMLHLKRKTSYADIVLYMICLWVSFFGMAFLASPLYRLLCQTFGWGGEITRRIDKRLQNLSEWRETSNKRGKNRKLQIRFDARTSAGMPWEFEPVQDYVITRPGESTLAFFTAENTSINPMTGLSIYTVLPFKAAPYFIKIQCFCFEEQRLRGKEMLDMPVLFFVDPAFLDDERMFDVSEITLSYVFYPVADDGEEELDDEDDEFWEEDSKAALPNAGPTGVDGGNGDKPDLSDVVVGGQTELQPQM